MSNLEEHLQRLDAWLASNGETPLWDGHLLAERAYITGVNGAFSLVMPCDPVSPAEYSVRLEELLNLGPGWINLSAIGLMQDRLVVSVEWQNPAAGVSVTDVAINLSGPSRVVAEIPGWDLERLSRDA